MRDIGLPLTSEIALVKRWFVEAQSKKSMSMSTSERRAWMTKEYVQDTLKLDVLAEHKSEMRTAIYPELKKVLATGVQESCSMCSCWDYVQTFKIVQHS
jgi:hypothetical protein